MNYNAAARDGLRLGAVDVVRSARHVVINHHTRALVPDLDAELIDSTATRDLAIGRRQDEPVVARAVDSPAVSSGRNLVGFRKR